MRCTRPSFAMGTTIKPQAKWRSGHLSEPGFDTVFGIVSSQISNQLATPVHGIPLAAHATSPHATHLHEHSRLKPRLTSRRTRAQLSARPLASLERSAACMMTELGLQAYLKKFIPVI
ncbi:hypothetical protein DPSP01_011936 [Paraphaeosphaeria sporulosa]